MSMIINNFEKQPKNSLKILISRDSSYDLMEYEAKQAKQSDSNSTTKSATVMNFRLLQIVCIIKTLDNLNAIVSCLWIKKSNII